MVVEDIKSHIDEILDLLAEVSEKSVNRDELESDFKKFLEYGVPIEQAKQTLIKKFGGSEAISFSSSERTLISDLKPNMRSVNLLCRIIAINQKEITVRGENRKIFYGIIGDESGTIPFTAWNEIEIEKGDVVEISNAYTREWQGTVQLNFGDRVNINKTDSEKLPESAFKPKKYKISDLRSGIGMVEVTVRILELEKRDTMVDDESKKVFSGIIGDESGKSQFTSWHDFKLKEGDVVKISGGYIKSWKGIPQLTFDDKADVKKLPKEKISKGKINSIKMPIFMLVEKRGAIDVETEGTIIEIRSGSGFVMRCPECNRALINDECSIHGSVKGIPDIRIKLVVDDGTGVIGAILNREVSEKLLGKTLDECRKTDEKVLFDEITNLFFIKRIKIRGNALGDNFGTTVIVKDAEFINVDVLDESEKLYDLMEEIK